MEGWLAGLAPVESWVSDKAFELHPMTCGNWLSSGMDGRIRLAFGEGHCARTSFGLGSCLSQVYKTVTILESELGSEPFPSPFLLFSPHTSTMWLMCLFRGNALCCIWRRFLFLSSVRLYSFRLRREVSSFLLLTMFKCMF